MISMADWAGNKAPGVAKCGVDNPVLPGALFYFRDRAPHNATAHQHAGQTVTRPQKTGLPRPRQLRKVKGRGAALDNVQRAGISIANGI